MKQNDKPKKTKRESIPKDESKVVKFKRVCTPRLRKAVKAIRLIGNCSTKDYAYSKEQVNKINNTLLEAISTVEKQFSGTTTAESAIEL